MAIRYEVVERLPHISYAYVANATLYYNKHTRLIGGHMRFRDASRQEFAAFLQRLIDNGFNRRDWQRWVIIHYYADDLIEAIRQEIFKRGQRESWTSDQDLTPESLQQVIAWRDSLLTEL